MAKKSGRDIMRWITVAFVVLMLIVSVGLLMAAVEHTFMNYYVWFAVIILLGIISALPCMRFWQWLTGSGLRMLCGVMHVVFFTVFISGLLLGLNFLLADFDRLPVVEATVADKYSETHYRSRRVGRNRYTRGEPYKVYKVRFELSDGRNRTFEMSLSRYNRLRRGRTAQLRQGPGALGIPVIAYRN